MSHRIWKKNSLRSFEIERRSRHSHKIQACRFDWTNWTNSTKHLANWPELWRKKQRIFPSWTSRRTASDVGCEIGTPPESTNGWMNQNDGYPTVGGFLALNMAIVVQKKTPIKCPHKWKDILLHRLQKASRILFIIFGIHSLNFWGICFLGSCRHT